MFLNISGEYSRVQTSGSHLPLPFHLIN